MRTQLRLITTAALAVAVPIGLVGCGSSSKKAADTSAGTTVAATSAATSTTVADTANAITIKGFSYGPAQLVVKPGTKVTWTNKDNFPHTVFEQQGPVKFDSGHINSDKSFSFTFTKKGTYAYICGIHNYMSGRVIVS